MVLSAERDFMVRPRREPWIGEEIVGVGHVQASTGEQLAFSFGLDGHFASDDGVHAIGWLDVLMMRVCIVVVVILIALFPCVVRLVGRIRSLLMRVDRLEDAAILHGMVRLRMELAGPLQCFGVVVFLVTMSAPLFNSICNTLGVWLLLLHFVS